jgi:hypothetical protein
MTGAARPRLYEVGDEVLCVADGVRRGPVVQRLAAADYRAVCYGWCATGEGRAANDMRPITAGEQLATIDKLRMTGCESQLANHIGQIAAGDG